ncbi:MAG: trypsin-like peptidase domain-containing protein, partial [Deltaproteobacteria bacterium]|nr:trypsin-like peptidase domain-containing protein [Deltaproteobacteria bacterium]
PVKRGPADWFVGATPGGVRSDERLLELHRAVGTGFIIDDEGYLITSAHLVATHTKLQARLHDGTRVALQRVGIDPPSDLALLRLKGPHRKIKALRLTPTLPEVGEWVVALGRPFGAQISATAGIVSAKPRDDLPGSVHRAWRLLQTDLRIHAGNAGGPIISMLGEVVGIATVLRQETEGVGFAVPAATIRRLLPTIKRHGSVKRAHIGAYIVPDSRARTAGLGDKKGALVESVLPGGPAARAGLRAHDIIVSFDGRPVERANDLWWLASLAGVERDVKVEVLRGKGRLQFHLRTQKIPD